MGLWDDGRRSDDTRGKRVYPKKAEALGLDVDMVELKIMKRSRRIKEG